MPFEVAEMKVQQLEDGRWKAEVKQLGVSAVADTEEAATAEVNAQIAAKTGAPSGRPNTKLPTKKEQLPDGTWKVWWPEVGIAGFGATAEAAARDFATQLGGATGNAAVSEALGRLAGPGAGGGAAAPTRPPAANIPDDNAALPHVTAADFETVIAGDTPVLIDFWASWCQPCLTMAPALVALQKEMGDRLRVAKVDVQSETDLARQCEIGAIPNLLLYRKGELVHRILGARGIDDLRTELAPFLA